MGAAVAVLAVSGLGTVGASSASAVSPTPTPTPAAGARRNATDLGFSVSGTTRLSVDVATGNALVTDQLLSLPGATAAVPVTLAYNSTVWGSGVPSAVTGETGGGWTISGFDTRLVTNGDGSATFYGPAGLTGVFTPGGVAGTFVAPAQYQADLVTIGGGWTLTEHASASKLIFNSSGHLTSSTDRNGNTTSYGYDPYGHPASITTVAANPVGPGTTLGSLAVGMSGSRMTSLTQTSGSSTRRVAFGYSSQGHLASVTDTAAGVTGFSSGGSSDTGQVVAITNPAGSISTLGFTSGKVSQVSQSNTAAGSPGTSVTRLAYPSASQTLVADPTTNQASAVAVVPHTTYNLTTDGSMLVASAADPNGHSRAATYTPLGAVASTTPAAGGSTSYTYGANNGESLTKVAAAAGAAATASYTNTGSTAYLPSSTTADSGNAISYTYNGAGNPLTTAQGAGGQAKVTYNSDGTPATSASPGAAAGVQTSYGYNGLHQLATMTPVTGSSLAARAYTWDPFGRLKTATDGRGNTITYSYDNADRIAAVAYSDAGTHGVTYAYDGLNRVKQRVDGAGTTGYRYDDLGKLLSTTNTFNGATISYTYDRAGALASETTALGTTTYNYDPAHQLTGMSYPQSGRIELTGFANDANGRRTDTWLQTNANHSVWAAHSHTDYDTSGRVVHVLGQNGPATGPTTVIDQSTCYSAGAIGPGCATTPSADRTKIRWVTDAVSGETTTYGYDESTGGQSGRLLTAAVTGGTSPRTYTYTYNTAGDRTGASVTGTSPSSQTLTFNNANQIATAGNSYDGAGNQTASAGGTASYNTAGQTTATTTAGTAGTSTYTYAGTNQNEPLKETTNQGGAYGLIYGRTDRNGLPLIEQVGVGALTGYILHDPSGLPVMIQTSNAVTVLYMYDGRNNPILLATSFSTTSYAQHFDPYGGATQTGGSKAGGGYTQSPYTFAGGIQDRATGHIKFGTRWFDPNTGTWTQQDTLNAPLDTGNGNRYTYAGGDPINHTDPSGASYFDAGVAGLFSFAVTTTCLGFVAFGTGGAALAVGPLAYAGCGFLGFAAGTYVSQNMG